MTIEDSVNELAGAARAITDADSPADVFRALLDASRVASPRAAVFLVRRGGIHGWGSVGFPTDVARSHRGFRAEAGAGWLAQVAGTVSGAALERPADAIDPDFGQAAAAQAVACALCIDEKPIAVLLAERGADEAPWIPDGLALLARVAGLRLELNLARRQAVTATAETSSRPEAATETPTPEITEPTESVTEDLADPALEVARRYARLVATDIRLYNEEAVMMGRRNGDLLDRIGEHIGRGKDTFLRRHKELGPVGLNLLHEAYVQVLAGGDDGLIPPGALE